MVTPVERLGHAVVLFAAQVGAMAARAPEGAAGRASGPREALVQVTVRHERYAATVRRLLDGQPQPPPRPRADGHTAAADDTPARRRRGRVDCADVDAAALARERSCPPGRLVTRLLRAQTALEALSPRADAAGLRLAFADGASARPWAVALDALEQHVRDRLDEVTGAPAPLRGRPAWRRPLHSAAGAARSLALFRAGG
jgi:hypothetical protein